MKSTSGIVEARLEFNLIIAGIIAAKSKPFFLDRNVLSNNNLSQHWKVSFCKSSQIYIYIYIYIYSFYNTVFKDSFTDLL